MWKYMKRGVGEVYMIEAFVNIVLITVKPKEDNIRVASFVDGYAFVVVTVCCVTVVVKIYKLDNSYWQWLGELIKIEIYT